MRSVRRHGDHIEELVIAAPRAPPALLEAAVFLEHRHTEWLLRDENAPCRVHRHRLRLAELSQFIADRPGVPRRCILTGVRREALDTIRIATGQYEHIARSPERHTACGQAPA